MDGASRDLATIMASPRKEKSDGRHPSRKRATSNASSSSSSVIYVAPPPQFLPQNQSTAPSLRRLSSTQLQRQSGRPTSSSSLPQPFKHHQSTDQQPADSFLTLHHSHPNKRSQALSLNSPATQQSSHSIASQPQLGESSKRQKRESRLERSTSSMPSNPPARRRHPNGVFAKSKRSLSARIDSAGQFLVIKYSDDTRRRMQEILHPQSGDLSGSAESSNAVTPLAAPRTQAIHPNDDFKPPYPCGKFNEAFTILHPNVKWIHCGRGLYLPAHDNPSSPAARMMSEETLSFRFWTHEENDPKRIMIRQKPRSAPYGFPITATHYREMHAMLRAELNQIRPHLVGVTPALEQTLQSIEDSFGLSLRWNWRDTSSDIYHFTLRCLAFDWHLRVEEKFGPPRPDEETLPRDLGWDDPEQNIAPPSEDRTRARPESRRTAKETIEKDFPTPARPRLSRQAKAAVQEQEVRRTSRRIDLRIAARRNSYDEDEEHEGGDEAAGDDASSSDHNEQAELIPDEDASMGNVSDDELEGESVRGTYKRSYVDAHPEDEFYHVGNGWYKRGSKPQSARKNSGHDSLPAQPMVQLHINGDMYPDITVRSEHLQNYPGQTFHHTGNGWYKPGAGSKGFAATVTVTDDGQVLSAKTRSNSTTSRSGQSQEWIVEVFDNSLDGPSDPRLLGSEETVDRAYTLRYPHLEWSHRGNGRYKRKSVAAAASNASSETPARSTPRRFSQNGSFSIKDTNEPLHEDDELDIVKKRTPPVSRSAASPEEEQQPVPLFTKAYVLAHPDEQFHHRGQGRYARGPRLKPAESLMDGEDSDGDGLVDSQYVKDHPMETFHHRGQGKWARGLPPPGSSNKVAVRGPGAKAKSEAGDQEVDEEGNRPPGPTVLVRRQFGPDKWPHLSWVYRGGGKWARTSKQEEMQLHAPRPSSPAPNKILRRSMVATRTRDGPEAQIQRETQAAAESLQSQRPSPIDDAPRVQERPLASRGWGGARRKGEKVSHGNTDDVPIPAQPVARRSPKAPSPKPPLLDPEEDAITPDDLPSIYKAVYPSPSPSSPPLDEADTIYRELFTPIYTAEPFVRALTKHDPAVRSLASLKQLAANAQLALVQLQDEYLQIDRLVASHPMQGKKERRPVRGGRVPIDERVWEDRKEAALYDYTFDPRKIGYQDPDAQRIVRDREGRELRRRRIRQGNNGNSDSGAGQGAGAADAEPIINEPPPPPPPVEEPVSGRRVVKPVSRFDGVIVPPSRKRSRLSYVHRTDDSQFDQDVGSAAEDSPGPPTPDRGRTPSANASVNPHSREYYLANPEEYKAPTTGRWKNHVPKRIRELRGESIASTARKDAAAESGGGRDGSTSPAPSTSVAIAPAPPTSEKPAPTNFPTASSNAIAPATKPVPPTLPQPVPLLPYPPTYAPLAPGAPPPNTHLWSTRGALAAATTTAAPPPSSNAATSPTTTLRSHLTPPSRFPHPPTSAPASTPPGSVRKGRPPGSKNLHKRKDAGIKKGPRKPKIRPLEGDAAPSSAATSVAGSVEPDSAPESVGYGRTALGFGEDSDVEMGGVESDFAE